MKRASPLKRSGRVKPVNRKRAAKRKARDFGPYADWIRTQPCCISGKRTGEDGVLPYTRCFVEAAHVRSRGAGGTSDANLVPLDWVLHSAQHTSGIRALEKKYGVDLKALAADYWAAYQLEMMSVGQEASP